MVMGVFLLFFTLMHMAYTHAKVQHCLNEVCKELSYDSYVIDELDITDGLQSAFAKTQGEWLEYEELKAFSERLRNGQLLVEGGHAIDQFDASSPISFVKSVSDGLELLDGAVASGKALSRTVYGEGIYYVTRFFGEAYIRNGLEKKFEESGLKVDFEFEHLELFLDDDSGVVVISYPCRLPLKVPGMEALEMKNSGYVRIFSGYAEHNTRYHRAVERSAYGKGEKGESDADEDESIPQVYLTPHGKKYHRNPACFHIKVNPYPVRLSAVSGKKPCGYCADDIDRETDCTVYTTNSGDVYHATLSCTAIHHHIRMMSEKEAIVRGYGPCGTCSRD